MERTLFGYILALMSFALPVSAMTGDKTDSPKDMAKRGEYIMALGGCASCHTDKKNKGAKLSGGFAMKTKFGTFYTPNITPDPETGIGGWSDKDFIDAMTKGQSPDGQHYYPAFPYTSYAKMSQQDLLDLKAYLDTVQPIRKKSKEHDLSFPFNIRMALGVWKFVNFDEQPFTEDQNKSEQWNRGAYLANGASHCVECHSPRNLMGGLDTDNLFAGVPKSPEGEKVPGLLPIKGSSFAEWTHSDLMFGLETGMTPTGDFLGGSMGKVIENTTSKMTKQDLEAIAAYLGKPNPNDKIAGVK